ncbi:MAG: DUF5915 domain-containing protein, partial [Actinomycetota bacterium]
LVKHVRDGLDNYEVTASGRKIQEFVDDLSNWYVRRSRRRFWKSEEDADKISAYLTLHECLVTVAKLLAPYTPFVSEAIYRNLVCRLDLEAPESVHLCDYPESNAGAIDDDLLFNMDMVRQVVNMGRAARNKAAIKNRQPLGEVIILTGEKERHAIDKLSQLVLEELNVKEIVYGSGPGQLTEVKLKPNLQLLGPRFGARREQVDAAIAALDPERTLKHFETDGKLGIFVDGREEAVSREEILVEEMDREGYAVERQGELAVGVLTVIGDELIREGMARELVHKVQNLRKDAGLEIEDTIALNISGTGEGVEAAKEYAEFISAETLCLDLSFKAEPLVGGFTEDIVIDGESLEASILKVGSIKQQADG